MAIPLRVLMVEDSEDDEAAVLYALRRSQYAVTHERTDTAAAMSAALDRGGWEVVLSDHEMPRFSSFAALHQLRERATEVPFIVVSGNIGEETVAAAMRAGADDYVSKRDLSRLPAAIERALRDRKERRERQRTEDALRESEERFALAVRGSRDGIWDWHLGSDHVYFSERFKEMAGLERVELDHPESLIERLDPGEAGRLQSAIVQHIRRRGPLDLELRITSRVGEMRWFHVRGQALWDEETGRATRIAGSCSDVTARKQAEAALVEQLAVTREQQEEIRELSVPIIEVWKGVLAVPVIGKLHRERAAAILDALCAAVVRTGCRRAVIDLTGVASIDAATADHLLHIVRAVQLLGAQGIVVGIRAAVADAIVSLGLDLSSITTLANLHEALVLALESDRSPKGHPAEQSATAPARRGSTASPRGR